MFFHIIYCLEENKNLSSEIKKSARIGSLFYYLVSQSITSHFPQVQSHIFLSHLQLTVKSYYTRKSASDIMSYIR